jgi:hypothetical protein
MASNPTSNLSQENILRDVHDAVEQRLRVDAEVTAIVDTVEVSVDLDAATGDNVAISDGTNTLAINVDGSVNFTDNGGSITVDATDLDIRNLTFATDKVDVTGSVITLDASTLSALESITVQNGSGASAVNIQDGGNSITVDGSISVNNFPATQDVTQATSPWIISGAVTANAGTNLNTSALALESGGNLASIEAQQTDGTQKTQINYGANLWQIEAEGNGPVIANVPINSSSYPDPSTYYDGTRAELNQDVFGNLQTRGPVLTDEISFRVDFDADYYTNGTNLFKALTGTIDWTNNATNITGIGTAFTTELLQGSYIKKQTDADTLWVQIDYVVNDTTLILATPYQGTTATATGYQAKFKQQTNGGSATVSNSVLALTANNGNNNFAYIEKQGDYLPFNVEFKANVSQRVANQISFFGLQKNTGISDIKEALIVFDGTVNTQIKCRTRSSSAAADTEETTITLPNGATTATNQIYKIDISGNQVTFLVNDIVVAIHRTHIPGAYDDLKLTGRIYNTTGGTGNGTLSIDYIWFSNNNRIEISNSYRGEPDRVGLNHYNPLTGLSEDLYSWGNNSISAAMVDLNKRTYSATNVFNAANLATDIFTITGSATKTVRINRIRIKATQTTAGVGNIYLLRRSTANTAGTSTTLTNTTHDSTNVAATATVRSYTANPTLGTLVGNLRIEKLFISTTSTTPTEALFEFGNRPGQCIVLRGITEVLAVNLNGVTFTGNSFAISIEWTEE